MSTTQDIAGIVPGLMGVALVGESMKMIPRNMTFGNPTKAKTPTKGKMNANPFAIKPMGKSKPMNYQKQNGTMIKGFTNIMVGTSLLGATAGMVNKL